MRRRMKPLFLQPRLHCVQCAKVSVATTPANKKGRALARTLIEQIPAGEGVSTAQLVM